MTDRTICLTVTIDKEYRIDDADEIKKAISMIKGVLNVTSLTFDHEAAMNAHACKSRFKYNFYEKLEKLFDELYP